VRAHRKSTSFRLHLAHRGAVLLGTIDEID
jgi:hypothetical protein